MNNSYRELLKIMRKSPHLKPSILAPSAIALLLSFSAASSDIDAPNELQLRDQVENIFEKYGISEDIPKLGISSLTQGENLVEHMVRTVVEDGEVHKNEVFMVKTTDIKGNIDLRIKYDPRNLDEDTNVIEEIESATKTEYLLRSYSQGYDKSSITATEKDNGDVIVEFNYSKYQLPQDIAYFRFMRVSLLVVDGNVQSMSITNNKPFDYEGYTVDSYKQDISFVVKPDTGQVFIKDKHIVASGSRKGKPVQYETKIKTIAYYDKDDSVVISDRDLLTKVSDPRMREEKVELDRYFPLMADLVRRQGIDVPLPYGVSVSYRKQDMDVGFTYFDIMGLKLDDFFDPEKSYGIVTAESMAIRADLNILPFWNVYVLGGKIKVDATVNTEYTGVIRDVLEEKLGSEFKADIACKLIDEVGLPICDPAAFGVPLQLDYTLAGFGTTLSIGYREFFASLTGTYAVTKLDGQDWGEGIVTVQPMVGYQLLDYRAQVFVGAEYQGLKANMEGNLGFIEELNRDFTYDVGVELNQWAYLVGINKQIGKHYNITALYNKGETREAFTLNFGYRF
ncbi:porin family protein [Shewanella gaetbuli]|uniref:Porin family protein n=1 Tax=Shewanella gaetbuli TaxID=220752 RepID=A0A9X1ZNY2_9GAMM|nr:porin family protein [Shewanella gaetbuli]MCL1143385.1 porin family protein [Shewanella gaetbuli]